MFSRACRRSGRVKSSSCFRISGSRYNHLRRDARTHTSIAKAPAAQTIIADKVYDSEVMRGQADKQGAKAVIPRERNSVKGNADLDRGLYRNRHLVESVSARNNP